MSFDREFTMNDDLELKVPMGDENISMETDDQPDEGVLNSSSSETSYETFAIQGTPSLPCENMSEQLSDDDTSATSSTDESGPDAKVPIQTDEPFVAITENDPDKSRKLIRDENEQLAIAQSTEIEMPILAKTTTPPERPLYSRPQEPASSPSYDYARLPKKILEFTLDNQSVQFQTKSLKTAEKVGNGAFGTVHKVKIALTASVRHLAVKSVDIMNENGTDIVAARHNQKIDKELKALKTIAIPGRSSSIIEFYGAVLNPVEEGSVCFLMEYMDMNFKEAYKIADSLRSTDPNIVEVLIRRVAYHSIKGLRDMSRRKLSHNDIKPDNILLNEHFQVKLGDLGESDVVLQGDEVLLHRPGTKIYSPPEYTEKTSRCSSARANLWALGISLLEAAENQHPFLSLKSDFDLLFILKDWKPPSLKGKVSSECENFILSLLQPPKPNKRKSYSKLLRSPFLAKMKPEASKKERAIFHRIMQNRRLPPQQPVN